MNKNTLKTILALSFTLQFSANAVSATDDVVVRLKPNKDFVVLNRVDRTQKFAVKIDGGIVFPLYASHTDLVQPVSAGECYCYWNTIDCFILCGF